MVTGLHAAFYVFFRRINRTHALIMMQIIVSSINFDHSFLNLSYGSPPNEYKYSVPWNSSFLLFWEIVFFQLVNQKHCSCSKWPLRKAKWNVCCHKDPPLYAVLFKCVDSDFQTASSRRHSRYCTGIVCAVFSSLTSMIRTAVCLTVKQFKCYGNHIRLHVSIAARQNLFSLDLTSCLLSE